MRNSCWVRFGRVRAMTGNFADRFGQMAVVSSDDNYLRYDGCVAKSLWDAAGASLADDPVSLECGTDNALRSLVDRAWQARNRLVHYQSVEAEIAGCATSSWDSAPSSC